MFVGGGEAGSFLGGRRKEFLVAFEWLFFLLFKRKRVIFSRSGGSPPSVEPTIRFKNPLFFSF